MTQKYIPQYLQEIVDLLKEIRDEFSNSRETKIEKALAPLQADIEYRADLPKTSETIEAKPKKTRKKNADN